MKFATLIKMTRPINVFIAIVTLAIGYFLLGELPGSEFGISPATFIFQALGFAFAISFANIQNDILDLENDKVNRPERPLPSEKISIKVAHITSIAGLVLTLSSGIANSVYLHVWSPFLFFTALALLLIFYNVKLKHIPLLKNMTVAFLCTTPLLLCMLTSTGLPETDEDSLYALTRFALLFPAMSFAFLLTTAREIYKDLEDEIGDLKAGIMTFPLIAGAKTARNLAGAIIIFTYISIPVPVLQGTYPPLFLILTGTTLAPCFVYIIKKAHQQKYDRAQKATKISMFAGLIALIISAAL